MTKTMRIALLSLFAMQGTAVQADAPKSDADAVKACIAEEIAGINAHDAAKATSCEADDTISMETGRPPSVGRDSYATGLKMAFGHEPTWHLRLIEEAVDVSKGADMAAYRSTYFQDSTLDGAPATQKVNYVAVLHKQRDGAWKIVWSVVSNIEKPHKV